jgi:hypothetical protein
MAWRSSSVDHVRRQACRHRGQQSEGEVVAAIGEVAPAGLGESPAIAGATGAGTGRAGLHQAFLLQGAQMTPHDLHGHAELIGQLSGGGLSLAQHQRQGGLARWGLGGGAHGRGLTFTPCHACRAADDSARARCGFRDLAGSQWLLPPVSVRVS